MNNKTSLFKKVLAFLLIVFLLSWNIVFAWNKDKNQKKTKIQNEKVLKKIEKLKKKQKLKEKKYAEIIWKADVSIWDYKKKIDKKWELYKKRNKKQIEKNLKKVKKIKLKLLKQANKLLKDNLEKDLSAEVVEWNLSITEKNELKTIVEPNYLFELQTQIETDIVTDDTLFQNQWGLQNIINGKTGNKLQYTGETVTVAVIDTGVDFSVEDLAWKQWTSDTCVDSEWNTIPGWCMEGWYDFIDHDTNPYPSDNYTHGTNVSGLIWANTNNNKGISSIANSNVEIMSLRTCCGTWNFFGSDDISEAIYFAVNNGADIINASFGWPTDSLNIKQAIEYANGQWVLFVAAAWNYASNNDLDPIYPANYDYPNVVSIGSINNTEWSSYFSNYWELVDIAAPGSNVYAVDFNNNYKTLNGTSFSTPFVTSTLARYKSQSPNLSVNELRNKLLSSSIQNVQLNEKVKNWLQLKLDPTSIEKVYVDSEDPVTETPVEDTTETDNNDTTTPSLVSNTIDERYITFMKQISKLRKWNISLEKQKDTISLSELSNLETELNSFIVSEKTKLLQIDGVTQEKISDYITLLESQLDLIQAYNTQINARSSETTTLSSLSLQDFQALSVETLTDLWITHIEDTHEIQALSDMSSFGYSDSVQNTQELSNYKIILDSSAPTSPINNTWLFTTETYVPVQLEDVQASEEIIISSQIIDLATQLNNNPVEIFNYVKNNIEFEPYAWVKKTNEQCFRDLKCNDYDTSSLLISLLRASGIPARYKQSHILVSKENVWKLLWVSDIKTAYYAFHQAKIPVYIMSNGTPLDTNFETADFSSVTHLVVKWTFAEMYYDYDHKWANHSNDIYFSNINTQADLDIKLAESSDREWLKIDPSFKYSTVINNKDNTNIVENSTINTDTFFEWYLQTGDVKWALESYKNKLVETSVATDITDLAEYSFNKTIEKTTFEMLPVTFPYSRITGTTSGGTVIEDKIFSSIVDTEKQKIEIELKDSSTGNIILKKSYRVTEVNNTPINLEYTWTTQADKDTIASYGSLHLTPSNLVNIQPSFVWAEFNDLIWSTITDNVSVKIWDSLTLTFRYFVNDVEVNTSSKYSIAWNAEGIYMNFSKMVSDSMDTDSKVLLAWNWAIAKRYLERLETSSNELEQISNRENTLNYSRAVVTQNRILNEIESSPTTFEFKWLTLDAHSYVNDYYRGTDTSNAYTKYDSDFLKIYGLYASEQEGQIFNDITGLTGISTVKGLQYAYANPTEYTIHEIDSSNKSVIDSLILSENTKTLMRNYVDEWRTITTPNKLVKNQAWEGLFYTAIDSDWEWVYAIGEGVVANWGFSVDLLNNYGEGVSWAEISCLNNWWISAAAAGTCDFNRYESYIFTVSWKVGLHDQELATQMSWWNQDTHGRLLGVFPYDYHNMIITSKSLYFDNRNSDIKSGEYNYWDSLANVVQKTNSYINTQGFTSNHKNPEISYWLWTFVFFLDGNDWPRTIYYTPTSNTEKWKIYNLHWDFLEKADKNIEELWDKKLIRILWLPISDISTAATIWNEQDVQSQNFINGAIHTYDTLWPNKEFYTFGNIDTYHKSNWWVSWRLWFPVKDPEINSSLISQRFDNEVDLQNSTSNSIVLEKEHLNYACWVAYNDDALFSAFWYGLFTEIQSIITGIPDAVTWIWQIIYRYSIWKWNIKKAILKVLINPNDYINIIENAYGVDVDQMISFIESSEINLDSVQQWIINEYKIVKQKAARDNCLGRKAYLSWRIVWFGWSFIVWSAWAKAWSSSTTVTTKLHKVFNGLKNSKNFKNISKILQLSDKIEADFILKWLKLTDNSSDFWKLWKTFSSNWLTWELKDLLNDARIAVWSNSQWETWELFLRRLVWFWKDNTKLNTTIWWRLPDSYDNINKILYEIKNYRQNVWSSPSTHNYQEIVKDTILQSDWTINKSVWIFIDKWPNANTINRLEKAWIEYILIK